MHIQRSPPQLFLRLAPHYQTKFKRVNGACKRSLFYLSTQSSTCGCAEIVAHPIHLDHSFKNTSVLCTTEDVKTYGFEKILRPLLHDLQILEQSGETKDTLEEQRITLLSEVTKRNNEQAIKVLMDRTFAHRRHEVVEDMPFIVEFKNRWPALFTEREVSAEFRRITTIPLVSKFLGQLDYFSNQLFRIFKKKGGAEAQKITNILSVMDQNITIEKKRECILKALAVYLNEDPSNLLKEYVDAEQNEALTSMHNTTLGIYVIAHEGADATDSYEDVGIIIEGVQVLEKLNVANACAVMLGLI
ncbi:uncharacterized protein LOC131357377 isoform X6 [Hemibagrus wyckioides]|uniref:uncharacterized protein LOC131357377 isoform X6 n=1 Tax=Hemibagrus wyckioides TaxID=337641 RepID=UPI00266C6D8C|nr:uncharacterized protein LOC131357377 isoform X6 [Hemibagrus wyckioides]